MTPRFQTPALALASTGFEVRSDAGARLAGGASVAATWAERMHSLLRRMPDSDWARFKALVQASLEPPVAEGDMDMVERLFRKGEAIGGRAGQAVGQVVQGIAKHGALLFEVKQVQERMREQVRFVLREMGDAQWEAFKQALRTNEAHAATEDEIAVLALVFRLGESVSNIEVAAKAAAHRASGRKLIQPEVAARNAALRAQARGGQAMDPEVAYREASEAAHAVEDAAHRAESTLASRYVGPGAEYRFARNTLFKLVDWILETPELLGQVKALRMELEAVPPLTRERMRWALHRMPRSERIQAIRLIPLNTILMFQEAEATVKENDAGFRATRDRRLACDFFVRGLGDEDLAAAHGLTLNAVKNALGEIVQGLARRPIARQMAHSYLARIDQVQAMTTREVRRRMKLLGSERRADIVNRIPACAWKARPAIQIHKRLFLDYLSGEWALEALVDNYNLEKGRRVTGIFKLEKTVTVRGANAAISGMLRKIALEPELRQCLGLWTSPGDKLVATVPSDEIEVATEDFLPTPLNPAACAG